MALGWCFYMVHCVDRGIGSAVCGCQGICGVQLLLVSSGTCVEKEAAFQERVRVEI